MQNDDILFLLVTFFENTFVINITVYNHFNAFPAIYSWL